MIGDALALLLVNGCLFVAGAGLTRALGGWRRPRELAAIAATSLLVGTAVFGVTAQLLYVLGLSLAAPQFFALCALLAATGARCNGPVTALGRQLPPTRLEWLAAALLGLPLLLLALNAVHQPLASWDAWAQWTPKALALVELDGLDSAVFASPAYADWHPDYPLLVPALEAAAFRFGVGVQTIHLQFVLMLAAFAVSLLELLRPRVGRLLAWSAVLAIVWTPKVGAETLSANADLPLAIFLVLAGVAAWLWIVDGSRAALGLFAVFGAAATATKLEGAVELAIVLGVALLFALRRSRERALLLVGAGALSLVGLVPLRLWAILTDAPSTYPASSVVDNVQGVEVSRVPISSLLLLRQLFDPEVWLVLVPLALGAVAVTGLTLRRSRAAALLASATAVLVLTGIAAAFVLPPSSFAWRAGYWLLFLPAAAAGGVLVAASLRVDRAAAYVACSLGGIFAALVAIYTFTPYDFAWHLGTSSSRVVLPLGLFAAALTPIVLSRALGAGSRDGVP